MADNVLLFFMPVLVYVLKIGRSSNGRTEAFEAFNLGSIPSLPAVSGEISKSYFCLKCFMVRVIKISLYR